MGYICEHYYKILNVRWQNVKVKATLLTEMCVFLSNIRK